MTLTGNQLLTAQQALAYAVMCARTEQETAEFALLKLDIDEASHRAQIIAAENEVVKSLQRKGLVAGHEQILFSFCKFIGNEGYNINGYDDGQLNVVIQKFLDKKEET